MPRGLKVLSVATALATLLIADSAWAQATAQLNGRVADESGAALPGVTVTATQTDTAFTRTVVTDETGAWTMTNMPIGPYRLEAVARRDSAPMCRPASSCKSTPTR